MLTIKATTQEEAVLLSEIRWWCTLQMQRKQYGRRCYEKAGFCDTGKRVEVQPGLVLAYYEKRTE